MSIMMDAMWEKMGGPPKCVGTDGRMEPIITFYPWQGKEWTFPWSRQETQAFGDEDEAEKVEFFFPHHRIVALGQKPARSTGKPSQISGLKPPKLSIGVPREIPARRSIHLANRNRGEASAIRADDQTASNSDTRDGAASG